MNDTIKNKGKGDRANEHGNTNTNNTSKKGFWFLLAFSAALLIIVGIVYAYTTRLDNQEISILEEQNSELNQQLVEHDSLVNDWVNSMVKVQEDLRTLQGKEKQLIKKSYGPELSPDLREDILAEIRDINALLEKNRAEIRRLNNKLNQSGIEIAALHNQVASLEQTLAERDSSITELNNMLTDREFQVAELNTAVHELNNDLGEAEQELRDYQVIVSMQDTEMNKAYIAMGNTKELEEQGVITKEGGFLGFLGRTKEVKPDLEEEPFSKVAITETKRISLNAKKAQLISDHPTDSYQMVENDSLVSHLEITNPEEFWKITRYAVVETRK